MVSRATELQRFSLSASAPQRSQNPSLRSERPLIYRTTLYINYSVEYRYVWVSLASYLSPTGEGPSSTFYNHIKVFIWTLVAYVPIA